MGHGPRADPRVPFSRRERAGRVFVRRRMAAVWDCGERFLTAAIMP